MGTRITAKEFMVQINRDRFEVSLSRDMQEIGLTRVLPGNVPGQENVVLKEMHRVFGEIPRVAGAWTLPKDHTWLSDDTEGMTTKVMAYIGGVKVEFLDQLAKLVGQQQAEKLQDDQLISQFRTKVGEEIEMEPRVVAKRAAMAANAAAGEELERELADLIRELRAELEERLAPFLYLADEREL
jgi:hypothetical protein